MKLKSSSLKISIEEAVKKSFIEIISNCKDIYSYALYSDENCETLSAISNTNRYLAESKIENEEDEFDHYSKFSPEEWDFQKCAAYEPFTDINKILKTNFLQYSFEKKDDVIKFTEFRKSFYNICIQVLKELNDKSFFRNNCKKDIFLLFNVTEYEFVDLQQKDIISRLNNNKYRTEYQKWIESLK